MVSVALTGSGTIGIVESWSVAEEAVPVSIGAGAASVGSCDITAEATSESIFVGNNPVTVTADSGVWKGRVDYPSVSGITAQVSAVSDLSFLNASRTAPPMVNVGSVSAFFGEYGITGSGLMYRPRDVAEMSDGSFVVVGGSGSGSDNKAMVFDSGGVFDFEFGTFGTGNGQFFSPSGVCVLSDGSIVVSDTGNSRVQKFNSSGTYLTKWGTLGTGDTNFNAPQGITRDATDQIWVADSGADIDAANQIRVFNSSGTFQFKFGSYGSGAGQFNGLRGIHYDLTNNLLFAADSGNARVQVFNSSGVYQYSITDRLTFVSTITGGRGPHGVNSDGTYVYVSDSEAGDIKKYEIDGTFVGSLGSYGTADDELGAPRGVLAASTGDVLVADFTLHRVSTVTFPAESRKLLSDVIDAYVALCDPDITHTVTYTAASDPLVAFPGWTENVWLQLNRLCATFDLQLDYDYSTGGLTFADNRTRTLDISNAETPPTVTPSYLSAARYVDVVNQNAVGGDGLLMYDAADEDARYSVDVGETVSVSLTIDSSAVSVNNPFPVDSDPGVGQYVVRDAAAAAVAADDWTGAGGSVTASVSRQTLTLTFTGPTEAIAGTTAPYYFVNDDGGALSVTGSGVQVTKETVRLNTGADQDRITREVGETIDIPFVIDQEIAYDRGIWACVENYADVTLKCRIPADSTKSIGEYQGSIITFEDSKYRVTRAVQGPLGVDITAKWHVTVGDFDTAWSGETVGDFDTAWSGYDVGDLLLKPLRT